MPTINMLDLLKAVRDGSLNDAEFERYFIVEPDTRRPFAFKIYINPDEVDVSGFEQLAQNADVILSHPKISRAKKRGIKHRYIVAEGDSWFDLPSIGSLVPKTMIDHLQKIDTADDIVNIAHAGDTLEDILLDGQFWPYVRAGYDLLLFSAGGNDILGNGNLGRFLNFIDPGHTSPADAPYYIKAEFYQNLGDILGKLENRLIIPLRGLHVKTQILMHGYDYVVPRFHGRWIGGPMEDKHIDPAYHMPLCQAIIEIMIDSYNNGLAQLAHKYPDVFHYFDLRGTIQTPPEWWDELHAKTPGSLLFAKKLFKKINEISPSKHLIAKNTLFSPYRDISEIPKK